MPRKFREGDKVRIRSTGQAGGKVGVISYFQKSDYFKPGYYTVEVPGPNQFYHLLGIFGRDLELVERRPAPTKLKKPSNLEIIRAYREQYEENVQRAYDHAISHAMDETGFTRGYVERKFNGA